MTDDLLSHYDALLADLDGTLYAGHGAIPGAADAIQGAARRGVRTLYVTNNASRRPSEVAAHLTEIGFRVGPEDVRTSAQAGAAMLAEQLPAGAPVLVVGTDALREEVTGRGLQVVERAAEAVAVVQGHSPDTGWRQLAEAVVAVRAGAVWVATNVDLTLPTERGPLPGNGSMVGVVSVATGARPQVAGKPAPRLMEQARDAAGTVRALVVGDRLDTDIEGAHAIGLDSLHVLTGVSQPADVLAAPPNRRPRYLAADLGALTESPAALEPGPKPGWTVSETGDFLVLGGPGGPALDALRALCAVHWQGDGGPVTVKPEGDAAAAALRELRIAD